MTTQTTPPAGPATWLPTEWQHPTYVPVDADHHLRPIRATDVDLDLPAVMGSRERLWSVYGVAWGWPPAHMTREMDLEDLARHEAEIEAHESFNYALFDLDETELLGCVYLDPPEKVGADAEISWWVVDRLVGSDVERALDELVPRWVAQSWPLTAPRYVGRDLSWDAWLALPDLPAATA
ncbi:GNAT family N-acetyltransferase [Nocardioides sp.]|uniref:GNAT family N-acetyltransferase n=1 Tax=Nocardioides sp. TaxID=35761 RepID=UPI001A1B9455|nr:GNAT family N-acetyltransferase [Nocardioides sp.]MBJ7357840.1 GNAT family N-acetyltransferase [Nocardioides sp.]